MKTSPPRPTALVFALALTTITGAAHAGEWSLATAFTYQGQLQHDGEPAIGRFDLAFELYDLREDGTFLGRIERLDVETRGGVFVVELDFGREVFADEVRWLEIQLRPSATDAFSPLGPRQRLAGSGTGCIVDGDVAINGTLEIDASGTVPDLRVACCNNVDDGGQLQVNGFAGALAISDSEIETTAFGSPTPLRINADGGNVGIGVTSPQAPLHLPAGPDVSPGAGGALVVGLTGGANIAIDGNEIMARSNGAAALLSLNHEGGDVRIGGSLDIDLEGVLTGADATSVTGVGRRGTQPSAHQAWGRRCSRAVVRCRSAGGRRLDDRHLGRRRGVIAACSALPAAGPGGRVPILRRPIGRGDRRRAGDLGAHGQA